MDDGLSSDDVALARVEEEVVPFCVDDESTDEFTGLADCVLGIAVDVWIELGVKECVSTGDGI